MTDHTVTLEWAQCIRPPDPTDVVTARCNSCAPIPPALGVPAKTRGERPLDVAGTAFGAGTMLRCGTGKGSCSSAKGRWGGAQAVIASYAGKVQLSGASSHPGAAWSALCRFPRRFGGRFPVVSVYVLGCDAPHPHVAAGHGGIEPPAGETDCISVQQSIPIHLSRPRHPAGGTHGPASARSPHFQLRKIPTLRTEIITARDAGRSSVPRHGLERLFGACGDCLLQTGGVVGEVGAGPAPELAEPAHRFTAGPYRLAAAAALGDQRA